MRPYCIRYSANAEQEPLPAVNSTGQTKDERKEKREKGKGRREGLSNRRLSIAKQWSSEERKQELLHISPDT